MKYCIDSSTSLIVERLSRGRISWRVVRVIDGAQRTIARGVPMPKADFEVKPLLGKLRGMHLSSFIFTSPKQEDRLLNQLEEE